MKKMLLLVDPQNDFISGSLPVPGAAAAMDNLAAWLKENGDQYAIKVVTCDWHPYAHCSFSDAGGQWPRHCVRHSEGAAIWPTLMAPLHEKGGQPVILPKGQEASKEEYSIFANAEAAERISGICRAEGIGQIDICGIAGDICVLSTLRDGIGALQGVRFNVLRQFSPSLDGGKALREFSGSLKANEN